MTDMSQVSAGAAEGMTEEIIQKVINYFRYIFSSLCDLYSYKIKLQFLRNYVNNVVNAYQKVWQPLKNYVNFVVQQHTLFVDSSCFFSFTLLSLSFLRHYIVQAVQVFSRWTSHRKMPVSFSLVVMIVKQLSSIKTANKL